MKKRGYMAAALFLIWHSNSSATEAGFPLGTDIIRRAAIHFSIQDQNSVQNFLVRLKGAANPQVGIVELSVSPTSAAPNTENAKNCGRVEQSNAIAGKLRKLLSKDDYLHGIAVSPDGKLVAVSVGNSRSHYAPTEILLADIDNKNVLTRQELGNARTVSDMCWSPDSSAIALVVKSSHTGVSPFNLWSFFAGHPVPYDDFFAAIFFVASSEIIQSSVPMVSNLKYGVGFAQWQLDEH